MPLLLICCSSSPTQAIEKNYTINQKSDGGYTIDIVSEKRSLTPITAEGIFPKITRRYHIELVGKGIDWSFRNQFGYYYNYENINSNQNDWDFGYAWIDKDREYIYLNLYQVKSPDGILNSYANGKYKILK